VDLGVAEGDVVALLGPNGSGKSTLLRTLSGILPPTAGRVLLDGDEALSLSPSARARRVAYVPQDEPHAFEFSIRQVVAMGRLPLSGGLFDTAEDGRAAEAALSRVGIEALGDRPVTQVSGGEKQLALVARALAQGGRILLMDEPTAHLDLRHQADFVQLVKSLAAEGFGIVVALHDPNLASIIADQILLLDGGHVAAHGDPRTVLASDALERVYALQFERVDSQDGSLRLLPRY